MSVSLGHAYQSPVDGDEGKVVQYCAPSKPSGSRAEYSAWLVNRAPGGSDSPNYWFIEPRVRIPLGGWLTSNILYPKNTYRVRGSSLTLDGRC